MMVWMFVKISGGLGFKFCNFIYLFIIFVIDGEKVDIVEERLKKVFLFYG